MIPSQPVLDNCERSLDIAQSFFGITMASAISDDNTVGTFCSQSILSPHPLLCGSHMSEAQAFPVAVPFEYVARLDIRTQDGQYRL